MKKLSLFVILLLIYSCTPNNSGRKEPVDTDSKDFLADPPLKSVNAIVYSSESYEGERINGPANIRDKPNGKILFSLNDGVIVETTPIHNKWMMVGVELQMTELQKEESIIRKGDTLFLTSGLMVGEALSDFETWEYSDSSCFISGYCFHENLKPESVPELILAMELSAGNKGRASLEKFIKYFRFIDYDYSEKENLTTFMIYESILEDPSPRDRISMLFGTDNNLTAIIHSRDIDLPEYNSYDLIRGHRLTIIADLQLSEIQNMRKKYINFYNSVD